MTACRAVGMTTKRAIKCRWCAWQRPPYFRDRRGKLHQPSSAYAALRQHVIVTHTEEFERLTERLEKEGVPWHDPRET